MTQIVNVAQTIDHYKSDFQKQESISVWLRDIRSNAMETFEVVGLPVKRRGNEKWKYTNISAIAQTNFEPAQKIDVELEAIKNVAPWDDAWTNLVFVNGFYNSELSSSLDEAPYIYPLSGFVSSNYENFDIYDPIGKYIDYSDDGFAALNTAFLKDAMVVNIPENFCVKSPINVIFYNTGITGSVNHPRFLMVANKDSKVSLIESFVGEGDDVSLTNSVSEIVGREGAEIDHYRIMGQSEHAFDVGYERVMLSDNSSFRSTSFCKSAKIGRYDLNVCINGTDASCELNGLYTTNGTSHIDNYINIDHVAPNGRSDLLYKGILDGKSKAVFGGTVMVRKSAQKTESTQSDKNLVLSSHAEVNSKPSLYIYADDVQCAHGATAGNIDSDTLFYMMSRGLDIQAASKLLIYGFAEEIISKVDIRSLRNYLESEILSSLPDHRFEF